jgi:hypothetical protein
MAHADHRDLSRSIHKQPSHVPSPKADRRGSRCSRHSAGVASHRPPSVCTRIYPDGWRKGAQAENCGGSLRTAQMVRLLPSRHAVPDLLAADDGPSRRRSSEVPGAVACGTRLGCRAFRESVICNAASCEGSCRQWSRAPSRSSLVCQSDLLRARRLTATTGRRLSSVPDRY